MSSMSYREVANILGVSVEYIRILKSKKIIKESSISRDGKLMMISEDEIMRLQSLGIGRGKIPRAKTTGTGTNTTITLGKDSVSTSPHKPSDSIISSPHVEKKSCLVIDEEGLRQITDSVTKAFRLIVGEAKATPSVGCEDRSYDDRIEKIEVEIDVMSSQITQILSDLECLKRQSASSRLGAKQVIIRRGLDIRHPAK